MDQRDSYCPYLLSSEITAKPTVLGYVLLSGTCHMIIHYLYPSDRSHTISRDGVSHYLHTTAGQEDPFELDFNLSLSSGQHGEDRKRQYITRICLHMHQYTTMKHRYLMIWLTYCISIASILALVSKHTFVTCHSRRDKSRLCEYETSTL